MLVETKQLKTVNATAEIYDDYGEPETKALKEKIENRCAEIALPHLAKSEIKDTA